MRNQKPDVTILIPTHNRANLLIRNLEWLSMSSYPIVIADSSNHSNSEEIYKRLSNTRIKLKYLHSSNKDYYSKISEAAEEVTSQYMVVCPDDDYILWQNIEHFHSYALETNASTICGRDLKYSNKDNFHFFEENSRYRRFCIRDHSSKIDHLTAGMNPIVCTYYQFYKTRTFKDIWKLAEEQKSSMPGNKFVEILFRSACFINGPVYFYNMPLRIIGDEPPLRSHDSSTAIQKYTLNFWDEFQAMKASGSLNIFIDALAEYTSKHLGIKLNSSRILVKDNILKPMLERMHIRHEILWDQQYSVVFSNNFAKDNVKRLNSHIQVQYSLRNTSFRLPAFIINLEDYIFREKNQWKNIIDFIRYYETT